MRAGLCNSLKRMTAAVLTVGVALGALPGVTAFADTTKDVAVPSTGQTTQDVKAYFNVTQEDLNALGYDLIVTVPLSFQLGFDKLNKAYKGSGKVSASGVLDSGKAVSVKIDTSHEKYGKIFVGDSITDVTSGGSSGFKSSLTTERWSQLMCYENLKNRMNSSAPKWSSDLYVTVPFSAFTLKDLGEYYTTVPLVISLTDEA